eukprot:302295-Rhodomonas_salina.2
MLEPELWAGASGALMLLFPLGTRLWLGADKVEWSIAKAQVPHTDADARTETQTQTRAQAQTRGHRHRQRQTSEQATDGRKGCLSLRARVPSGTDAPPHSLAAFIPAPVWTLQFCAVSSTGTVILSHVRAMCE